MTLFIPLFSIAALAHNHLVERNPSYQIENGVFLKVHEHKESICFVYGYYSFSITYIENF